MPVEQNIYKDIKFGPITQDGGCPEIISVFFANADSDIDIAVLLPFKDPRQTTWSLSAEAQLLAERLHKKVDLVNFSMVSCVLQKEVLSAGNKLFSTDEFVVGNAELQALRKYRELNERNAPEFARIARTGKVYA